MIVFTSSFRSKNVILYEVVKIWSDRTQNHERTHSSKRTHSTKRTHFRSDRTQNHEVFTA